MIERNSILSRQSLVLVFALVCSSTLYAQTGVAVKAAKIEPSKSYDTVSTATPEQVGLSLKRLNRIDNHMQGYIDRKEAAGALAVIARRGKIAYFKKWGHQNREAEVPMSDDTIFRIYSMSKPITTAAVMMLMEEGHFYLNDPIAKFMPEFAEMEVQTEKTDPKTGEVSVEIKPATRPITVRDLIRHTAGFTYGIFGNTQVDQEYRKSGILTVGNNLEETSSRLARLPLRFEPGTQFHYSVSVDVAGRLVEVVSGMPFDQFLRERMFEPLGMTDTGFRVPTDDRNRFAILYTPKGTQTDSREAFLTAPQNKEIVPMPVSADRGDFDDKTMFLSGGGGMVSTALDYLRFSQMMLNGGELNGARVLSRKSVELMTADHMTGIKGYGGGMTFGLGFGILKDVGQTAKLGSPGTYDWGGAAGTKFWIDPTEELIGVFMVQSLPHQTRMGEDFRQLTYQAIAD
jgi:CubicO group peptidase (beta-lactamase class C family)